MNPKSPPIESFNFYLDIIIKHVAFESQTNSVFYIQLILWVVYNFFFKKVWGNREKGIFLKYGWTWILVSKTYERSDSENCGANHKCLQKPSRSNATIGNNKVAWLLLADQKAKIKFTRTKLID